MIIALAPHQYGFKPFGAGGSGSGELLADPEFNQPLSPVTWQALANWSIAGGKATNSGGDERLYQLVPLVAGKTYRIFIVVEGVSGGGIAFNFIHPDNGSGIPDGYRKLIAGDNDFTVVAPATEQRWFAISGNYGGAVVLSASLQEA